MSTTHGAAGRHQHIWTFAAGLTESNYQAQFHTNNCPCDTEILIVCLHLLAMITFVRVAIALLGATGTNSIPTMFSGMVGTVHPPVHAVSSTTLHGLQRT